jgi:non-canonical purine NTP pyrophosphatase (RdgB/HAM1 family)
MARVLLVGSGNPDKTRELEVLLRETPWQVKSLNAYPGVKEPDEIETTFAGNALLKARYYCDAHGVACVADDSGLEVAALSGAPGIYSARYAGPACSYSDNNAKLLSELAQCGDSERQARFVCCAAYADPDGTTHVVEGMVEGCIATACRGEDGFGYDPLFIPDGFSVTFAEMGSEEKHRISHRGRAFATMRDWLAQQF